MAMVTATVTIGRGVQGTPMHRGRWDRFKTALRFVFAPVVWGDLRGEVYFDGEGEGTWDGKPEQAYTVIVGVLEDDLPRIRLRLMDLGRFYEQDSIALTYGETQFVSY